MSIGRERDVSGARGKEECERGEKVSGVREECVCVAREECELGKRAGV